MTPERWRQITDIFHSALGRTEADRSAFVARTCDDDAALRREVESMLAAHRDAGSFGEPPLVSAAATLEPGSSIGPYRIERWLAAGGMGQVYKAVDTRLGRPVALKILAPELANDPEFQFRFAREARTISQLDHHHICGLYDVGGQDGTSYLVMQYLDGETLAQRLERGALPIEETIAMAVQIADALDAAHTAGIIHRDLKPANIFLTRSGVKLLDFGLAKPKPNGASSAPEKAGLTIPGMLLGTVPYMAPEQLEGKETDARTDLFALGTVIYEMVTARRPFDGEHQANVISSIMSTDPPPISASRADVPAALDRVVAACLAKDPEARWQSARDVKRALGWILVPAMGSGAVVSLRLRWRRDVALAGVALLVGAVLASVTRWPFAVSQSALDVRAFRFEVVPPEGAGFAESPAFMAVSPDGRALAWHGPNGIGQSGLWVRFLDSSTARMVEGTEGGVQPFWSPDSRFLAFIAAGKLKKVDMSGGLAQTLTEAPASQSGTWSRDDVIVFKRAQNGPLYRVSATGGSATPVTLIDRALGETGHFWPQFLPDGKHFLFQAKSTQPDYDGMIYVGSLNSLDRVVLLSADSHAVYVPQGYLLFMQSLTLVAQPFDAVNLRTTGEPVPIAEQPEINSSTRRGAFSVSQTGVLAYRPIGETQLTWFDRSGRQLAAVGPSGPYRNPALSPDGQRLAVARVDLETGAPDIWLIELNRGVASRFTSHPSLDDMPLWSPDGSRIAFKSSREGHWNVYQKSSNGHGREELLLTAGGPYVTPMDWSDDGFLVYAEDDHTSRFSYDLWRFSVSGDRKPIPILRTKFTERQAQLSPDGRWIAYVSNDSGRNEINVSPFPSGEGKWQISINGGIEPMWRGDGKEIFFLGLDRSLMAASLTTTPSVQAGMPVRLFQTSMRGAFSSYTRNQYVSTADGQRFLIDQQPQGKAPSSSITVIVNWMAALRK